jgi:hypothetical protein
MPPASPPLAKYHNEKGMTSLTDSAPENSGELSENPNRQAQDQTRRAADKATKMSGENAETGQQLIPDNRRAIQRPAISVFLGGAIGFVLGRITDRP